MLIRFVATGIDGHAALAKAARPEIARVMGPSFRFPEPQPVTAELRIYQYHAATWWVALPLMGTVDTWVVDRVEPSPDVTLHRPSAAVDTRPAL